MLLFNPCLLSASFSLHRAEVGRERNLSWASPLLLTFKHPHVPSPLSCSMAPLSKLPRLCRVPQKLVQPLEAVFPLHGASVRFQGILSASRARLGGRPQGPRLRLHIQDLWPRLHVQFAIFPFCVFLASPSQAEASPSLGPASRQGLPPCLSRLFPKQHLIRLVRPAQCSPLGPVLVLEASSRESFQLAMPGTEPEPSASQARPLITDLRPALQKQLWREQAAV